MTLQEFASRLDKAKKHTIRNCDGYIGVCPAHEDAKPSLGVWEGPDGWLHVKCISNGCSENAILAALGLTQEDRRIQKNGRSSFKLPTVYKYQDADGKYLFEKVRFEKNGEKGFYQQIVGPDGVPNRKVSDALGAKSKVLYRLPEVLKAVESGEPIYICEGEKAVERMRAVGFTATCQPAGADGTNPSSKWLPLYTDALKGANAVIIADRDTVGLVYGRYVAKQIKTVAASVRLVQSATTAEKDDAYDHLEAGHSVSEFVEIPLSTPPKVLKGKVFNAETFEPIIIRYLWEPRLARGKNILWDADGGTSKTCLLTAIAAGLSHGTLPNGDGACEPTRTLYFHKGEDMSEEIATVYVANGGDLSMIEFIDDPDFMLDDDGIEELEAKIKDGGFVNIVFDALYYFCGHVAREGWKDPLAVLPILHGLARVGHNTQAVFNNIRHTTKGIVGKAASELGFGSVQFRNSHRGQMVMRYHPTERGLVIVTDEKGSLLVPRADPFAFCRMGEQIEYVHTFDNPFDAKDTYDARMGLKNVAKIFLKEYLAHGPKYVQDITRVGDSKGISYNVLCKALKEINGEKSRDGFGKNSKAIWFLPADRELVYDPSTDVIWMEN